MQKKRKTVLGLTTPKRCKIRGDLIETYNFVPGKENVNSETFFPMIDPDRHSKSHDLELAV